MLVPGGDVDLQPRRGADAAESAWPPMCQQAAGGSSITTTVTSGALAQHAGGEGRQRLGQRAVLLGVEQRDHQKVQGGMAQAFVLCSPRRAWWRASRVCRRVARVGAAPPPPGRAACACHGIGTAPEIGPRLGAEVADGHCAGGWPGHGLHPSAGRGLADQRANGGQVVGEHGNLRWVEQSPGRWCDGPASDGLNFMDKPIRRNGPNCTLVLLKLQNIASYPSGLSMPCHPPRTPHEP